MGGIFISYRRDDSAGWTGRLSDCLKDRLGAQSVFMDLDAIEPGAKFGESLSKAVASCDVLLAVIGPEWATATNESGKARLEDPTDWVRTEIAAALQRGIRVIPVLVGGASVPSLDHLPTELHALTERQAHELTDRRWNYDVEQLIKAVPVTPPTVSRTWPRRPAIAGLSAVALATALAAALAVASWMALGVRQSIPRSDAGAEAAQERPAAGGAAPIHLRAGQEARLKDKFFDYGYKILAADISPQGASSVRLALTLRMTNNGSTGANFWDTSFRVLVEGVPRAPIGNLNKIVDSHSAEEGVLEFELPNSAPQARLQVREGERVAEMTVDLQERIQSPAQSVAAPPSAWRSARFPLRLPAGQEARLRAHGSDYVYAITAAEVDRLNGSALLFRVHVRLTNNTSIGMNLWDSGFRLLVDGVPRAPITDLNEVVDAHSAKDAVVEFDLPEITQWVLVLRSGDEVAEIPFRLAR